MDKTIEFKQGLAQNKWHVVRSNKNPKRIMSWCGKVLTGESEILDNMENKNICHYCVSILQKQSQQSA